MVDYIGKYVKKFESGSKGSLSLSQSGNDWGLSCGSYQLTLRWGNCIQFLKKYFPSEAVSLYYNGGDIKTDKYPGAKYCSDPDTVKAIWIKCYNKVGADKFFEYEHEHIKHKYYDKIKEKIKPILDLDEVNDRAFHECFWSFPVHEGVKGSYNMFMEVIEENHFTNLDFVDKEAFFDLIYDKRVSRNGTNRYRKGLMNGSSERETLRPLLTPGTFSGKDEYDDEIPHYEDLPNPEISKMSVIGKIRNPKTVLSAISYPDDSYDTVDVYTYGDTMNIVGITTDNKYYLLDNTLYIKNTPDIVIVQENISSNNFVVRVTADSLPILGNPSEDAPEVGTIRRNQSFTIIEESNGYGLLKSKAGWISLSSVHVKKVK